MRTLAVLMILAATGCDRTPTAEGLPEWKPSDHDRLANAAQERAQPQRQPQPPPAQPEPRGADAGPRPDAGSSAGSMSTEELADVAWKSQCSTCHGPSGRGDGPQAPMLYPPDFSSKDWQAQRTDAQLAASIVNGKNKMPKFELPERVVTALVARVRSAAP